MCFTLVIIDSILAIGLQPDSAVSASPPLLTITTPYLLPIILYTCAVTVAAHLAAFRGTSLSSDHSNAGSSHFWTYYYW